MPGKGSVLIVDDEPIFRKLLSKAVSGKYPELSIAEAGDGTTAMRKLEQDVYDLVVLDVNMPVRDGFEVLEAIRSHKEISAVPVIMCTGTNYKDEVQRLIAMGISGYIVKSTDTAAMTKRLLVLIDDVLAAKSPVLQRQQQNLYEKKVSLLNSVLVIADENKQFRNDLEKLLKSRYTVFSCADIKDVFAICRKVRPVVLLLGRTADTHNSNVALNRVGKLAVRLHMTVVRMLPNKNMLRMFNGDTSSPVEIGIVRTMNAHMVAEQVGNHISPPECRFMYRDGIFTIGLFAQALLSETLLLSVTDALDTIYTPLVHTVRFDTSEWHPGDTVEGLQVSRLKLLAETAGGFVENVQITGTVFEEESPVSAYVESLAQ